MVNESFWNSFDEQFEWSSEKVNDWNSNELLDSLKDQLERINIIKEYSWNAWKHLYSKLTPEDYSDEEAQQTIELLEKYKQQYEKAVNEWHIVQAELEQLNQNLHQLEDNLEYSKWIDMDDNGNISVLEYSNQEISKMSNREFLQIPESERLQYVTTDHTDVEKIIFWEVNEIEFNFDQDWDWIDNKELFRLTTAWQVLPDVVRSVESDWVNYIRSWLNWEFFNENWVRLKIYTWTKISIWEICDANKLMEIKDENNQKYKEFIAEHDKYSWDEYRDVIITCVNKWLEKEEIEFILWWDFSKLEKFDKNWVEKLLVTMRFLDNSWLLDNFVDASEILDNIKDLKEFLDKYWDWIDYTVDSNWKVSFNWDWGIPEWLDVEPSLEKVIAILKSQLGVHESTWAADKYFNETWYNLSAAQVPWCAAFVNWVVKEAWYQWTWSNLAKSFIGWTWYWHVWFKLGNKILWWNQWNCVSINNINKPIVWWVMPENIWNESETHKNWPYTPNDVPDWAIIVYDRNTRNKRYS